MKLNALRQITSESYPKSVRNYIQLSTNQTTDIFCKLINSIWSDVIADQVSIEKISYYVLSAACIKMPMHMPQRLYICQGPIYVYSGHGACLSMHAAFGSWSPQNYAYVVVGMMISQCLPPRELVLPTIGILHGLAALRPTASSEAGWCSRCSYA
jgi:hypothetical protein